ncbi:uncharacterized protein MYCFIDRAFT_193589 [Pseudocercospora fijiensis CIRAD86]|uniref:Uncharacterized protein n=1 Tax=Pseudocercospora fijiensis (strain CIRAD86) TaxID=383855 RepID=N1QBZ7_PSEFD|nr:uncharacterized protein MYCFIDRAFT_193589 [Pseudocercospora fijiensis CIRAD86]EME89746.1 hypothetical protein MYCFIDRAFT_193589 [Pseudocercospora fijiensis CIRAD86]
MAIGLEQRVASYGFLSTYFNSSFFISLFTTFKWTTNVPPAQDNQHCREAQHADPPPTHTLDTYLDEVIQDTTQTSLSPEIQAMQRAARTAYLERLARISDRTSLQCLENSTKSRLELAARLDRESLEKLERVTKMLEKRGMRTPPKGQRWQFNAHASPVETQASSSSESKRVHSISISPTSPCERVVMRRASEGSVDEENFREKRFEQWMEQDIAGLESRGKVELGFFEKDLDSSMMVELPVKIENEFFNGAVRRGQVVGEREEGVGSVELNPEFADYDQEEEEEEEDEEWTDLGEVENLEDE